MAKEYIQRENREIERHIPVLTRLFLYVFSNDESFGICFEEEEDEDNDDDDGGDEDEDKVGFLLLIISSCLQGKRAERDDEREGEGDDVNAGGCC